MPKDYLYRGEQVAGQWVLVEARMALLSIGTSLFNGQSPRSQLDPLGRRFLLPLLESVIATGARVTHRFTEQGVEYQAEAVPVVGPSGVVHAAMGFYVPAGEQPGPRPEIGAWEWDWPAQRTYWTPELFEVWGLPYAPGDRLDMAVPEWFSLSEPGGFPRLMEVMTRFRLSKLTDLQIHLFRVARKDTGVLQQLRLTGRTIFGDGGEPKWFRGVTVRVDGYQGIEQQFNWQQYLDAALTLNPAPVCFVDLGTMKIMLNNTPWEQVGLTMPDDGLLTSAVHPEDRDYLRTFIASAPVVPAPAPALAAIRFAAAAGWAATDIGAVRLAIREGDLEVAQAMVRLQPRLGEPELGAAQG